MSGGPTASGAGAGTDAVGPSGPPPPRQRALIVLNPNASDWMTQRVVQQIRRRLSGQAEVVAITAASGPPVIDDDASFAAGAAAAHQALPAALARHPEAGAVLLACFGDPGLEALRQAAGGLPVHGLAELAMREAAAGGRRFAVLTCGPAWGPLLTQRAGDFGVGAALAGVWTLPVNGRALALDPDPWRPALQQAADAAIAAGAQALVLGGAAFAGLGPLVQCGVPVIDSVDAAAAWCARCPP